MSGVADSVAVSVAIQSDKPVAAYGPFAAQAEELGFDGVSVFHDLGFQTSLLPLLEMARTTSRVRLGAACLNPVLLHPVEIAGQAAALDLASSGRGYVGLARGAWLDRVGAAAPRPLARLREAAEVVSLLLAGDPGGYDGTVFRISPGFVLEYARARDRMDVLLGVWGPRGVAVAAGVADEVKLGGCANPDMVRLTRSRLDAAGGTGVGVVAGAVTVVDPDGAAARALARTEVAMYLDVVGALDETVDVPDDVAVGIRGALAAGDREAAGRLIPDELLHRFAFAGTPDEIADHAATLVAAGASRIEFGTPLGRTTDLGVELLGRRVLPVLREV